MARNNSNISKWSHRLSTASWCQNLSTSTEETLHWCTGRDGGMPALYLRKTSFTVGNFFNLSIDWTRHQGTYHIPADRCWQSSFKPQKFSICFHLRLLFSIWFELKLTVLNRLISCLRRLCYLLLNITSGPRHHLKRMLGNVTATNMRLSASKHASNLQSKPCCKVYSIKGTVISTSWWKDFNLFSNDKTSQYYVRSNEQCMFCVTLRYHYSVKVIRYCNAFHFLKSN